jgi:hypothetical protein
MSDENRKREAEERMTRVVFRNSVRNHAAERARHEALMKEVEAIPPEERELLRKEIEAAKRGKVFDY